MTPTSSQPTSQATSPSLLGDTAGRGDQSANDTATPTPTPMPTPTSPCDCWPQDIEGVTPEAPTPGTPTPTCEIPERLLGYKHVGYGVCEAVIGCEAVGSDVDEMFTTMDACLDAFEDCVCVNCEPLSTPIPIPSPTLVPACDHCSPGTDYLDWREWYPMDRGQKPGERAINWWTQPGATCFRGQSTYNYDGIPKGFPAQYAAQCLDYFFNWGCLPNDPDCNDYERRLEIITERRNPDGSVSYLDTWGVGSIDNWQVYFDPNQLGDGSACACNEETISALTAEERKAKRVPSSFVAPCRTGEWAYGNVACAATFVKGEGDGTRGWDEAHLGIPGTKENDPVSLWVTRTKVQEFLQDADKECNIALLVNEYLSTACKAVERDCSDEAPQRIGDPRCEFDASGNGQARYFTFNPGQLSIGAVPPLPTAGPGTPAPTAVPCEGCDLKWCMVMREEYYVRQVPLSSPLTGGDYEHTGGFGGLEWMSLHGCAGDNCPYWYIDRLEGVVDTPTPGYTPTPGPTLTPVTIEDEAWRTRCRRPGNCGAPGTSTPEPSFCTKPTNTPIPLTPEGNSTDLACAGLTRATLEARGTLTATSAPLRTVPAPSTPIPTDWIREGIRFPTDSAPTCVPSSIPTLTPTKTSTPTSTATSTSTRTATATHTPTATATPLPLCDTQTAQRPCPVGGANCGTVNGCPWEIGPLSFGSLSCDDSGSPAYDVKVTATECGSSNVSVTLTFYTRPSPSSGWQGPYTMNPNSSSPRSWTGVSCFSYKPQAVIINWKTQSSNNYRGMASASIEVCCVEACP